MKNKPFIYLQLAISFALIFVFAENSKTFAQQGKNVKPQKKIVKKTVEAQSVNAIYEDLRSKVRRIAQEEGVNVRLFEALLSQESNWRMNAVSYKGAKCMTQLMPGTARRYGLVVNGYIDERLNVDKCLRVGARYLRYQLDLFKDFRLALAGYNAGEGAVMKYGNRIPPYKETIQYVEKIAYNFTGQAGHGTAFAWNLPVAANYSQAVYSGRSNLNRIRQTNQSSPVERQPMPPISVASTEKPADAPESETPEEKPTVNASKPVVEDKSGRVPAASLFFWSKPNPK